MREKEILKNKLKTLKQRERVHNFNTCGKARVLRNICQPNSQKNAEGGEIEGSQKRRIFGRIQRDCLPCDGICYFIYLMNIKGTM